MTKREDVLAIALHDLREEYKRASRPLRVEASLRAATRARRPITRHHWIPAAAAAGLAAFLLSRTWYPATRVLPAPPPAWTAPLAQNGERKPSAVRIPRRRFPPVRAVRPTDEYKTSFLPIPASEAFPPPAATTILRAEIRKGDLRQFGLEVPVPIAGERIRVEFIVGDDGLARAVRFVQ